MARPFLLCCVKTFDDGCFFYSRARSGRGVWCVCACSLSQHFLSLSSTEHTQRCPALLLTGRATGPAAARPLECLRAGAPRAGSCSRPCTCRRARLLRGVGFCVVVRGERAGRCACMWGGGVASADKKSVISRSRSPAPPAAAGRRPAAALDLTLNLDAHTHTLTTTTHPAHDPTHRCGRTETRASSES